MTTHQLRTTALALSAGAALLLTAACGNGEDTPEDGGPPVVPETTDDDTTPGQDETSPEEPGQDETTGPGAAEEPDSPGDAPGSDAQVPSEYEGVLAAIDRAVAEHDGAPAFEVDDGDGGIWEVHVAVGEDDIEVHVSPDGSEVLGSEREADLDSEDRDGLQAAGDLTLAEAVRIAVGEYGGTAPVDEVTISDDGPDAFAWEVTFTDDVEVYLDIATGEVLRVETD